MCFCGGAGSRSHGLLLRVQTPARTPEAFLSARGDIGLIGDLCGTLAGAFAEISFGLCLQLPGDAPE